jgi:hypothetical protein
VLVPKSLLVRYFDSLFVVLAFRLLSLDRLVRLVRQSLRVVSVLVVLILVELIHSSLVLDAHSFAVWYWSVQRIAV